MKKYEYKTINCTFTSGSPQFQSNDIKLPPGTCVAIAAFYSGDAPSDKFIQIGVYDDGVEIQEPTHVESWRKSAAGTYLSGFRPFSFQCDRNVHIKATSDEALAADFKFQMMFIIDKEA